MNVFFSDKTNYGCSGGNTETAYEYVKSVGGLELDSNYPYTSYYDESVSEFIFILF